MIGLIEESASTPQAGYLMTLVESIFKKGGHLQKNLALDHRPQQYAMALAVADTLESGKPLLFEAGTGVGKSLAYLVPGLIHAVTMKRPCVISSHTITLQEQIRSKDLEICRQLFQTVPELKTYAIFKTALMVGRGNYCCTSRLKNALKDAQTAQSEMFPSEERTDLIRLLKWSTQSTNGVIQELSPPPLPNVWDAINADSSTCSRKNCDPAECFYQRARLQLQRANCVIVNHSLLFALINAGMPPEGDNPGILLPDDFVILDEAHRIPAIATDHFGIHVSNYAVDRALKRIYNPKTRRGVLKKEGDLYDFQAVEDALDASHEFFANLRESFLLKSAIQRLHEPEFCENIIGGPLKAVAERLGACIQKSDSERQKEELQDHRARLLAFCDAISSFIRLAEDDHVHWLERGGKKGQLTQLRSAPLDIAPALREHIFSRQTAAVLTSATLSNGRDLNSFQTKVGAEAAEAQIESSPFDYQKNTRLLIAQDAPPPQPGEGRLDLDYLANMICWCSRRVAGGTLVLFTSHFDLRQVRERAAPFFEKIKRPLFAQGHDHARNELTRHFAAAGNGILFGTDSFWTGVDVPGPALSQVIITRLPFENPGHPVSEARSEDLRRRGGNPFAELVLPEALVRFRQGAGRLIRRAEDQGNVVILDSRILSKTYGRYFIEALPMRDFHRFDRNNRESVFSDSAFA
jgi:ATP-dependent DNA helicase DinG